MSDTPSLQAIDDQRDAQRYRAMRFCFIEDNHLDPEKWIKLYDDNADLFVERMRTVMN